MDLIFASNNKHKCEEIRAMLDEQYHLLSLEDIGCKEEIPETHPDLQGNALQKAEFIYQKYHKNCFADDTGLEIDCLDNRPGVYSARYAGEHCSFEDNMNKVLQEMGNSQHRKAQFRTVISLILNDKKYFFEGIVHGQILTEKQGNDGFGYDPIFLPDGYSQSFAEMDLTTKNAISHRGQAVKKLIAFLKNYNYATK